MAEEDTHSGFHISSARKTPRGGNQSQILSGKEGSELGKDHALDLVNLKLCLKPCKPFAGSSQHSGVTLTRKDTVSDLSDFKGCLVVSASQARGVEGCRQLCPHPLAQRLSAADTHAMVVPLFQSVCTMLLAVPLMGGCHSLGCECFPDCCTSAGS